jgi:hypothetical protein
MSRSVDVSELTPKELRLEVAKLLAAGVIRVLSPKTEKVASNDHNSQNSSSSGLDDS